MGDPCFFAPPDGLTLARAAALVGAKVTEADAAREVRGIAPLDGAGPGDLAFLDNPRYLDALRGTAAEACLVAPRHAEAVPPGTAVLLVAEPYRAFARLSAALYPAALRPGSLYRAESVSPDARVHVTARIESGARVDPGAVIGPEAEVGAGTVVAANAVIGPGVRVGRDCAVGPGASLVHALLGNRVIVGAGARLGGDGFGFAMGAGGHLKVPQIGRVIVQDDVEIGANTCIDRGANRDTVIGEGTKIDNLVQIGHNVVVGRHCVIVAGVGISGSAVLEDYVVLGGQVGVVGHLRIGAGAQIAGSSNVATDVPPGVRWGGTPAKPVSQWFREIKTLARLAKRGGEAREDRG